MGKKLAERDLKRRLEQIGQEILEDLKTGKRKIEVNKTTLELDLLFDGEESEIYEFPGFEWIRLMKLEGGEMLPMIEQTR